MKKINLNEMKKLGRDEMRKIMAGSGDCQSLGENCYTVEHLNCCSHLICASNKCQTPTR